MKTIIRRIYPYKFFKIFSLICCCLTTLLLLDSKSAHEKKSGKKFANSLQNFSDHTLPSVKNRMKINNSLICLPEYQSGNIEAKEFFIFKSGIVWCNVFKSASTSVLHMLGSVMTVVEFYIDR